MRFLVCIAVLLIAPVAHAQGFNLKPGEKLISVDGKPVAGQAGVVCKDGKCNLRPAAVAPHQVRKAGRQMAREIRRDIRAYAWCLREAQLCAANGYRQGHPRGNCPGASCTGTGYSHSPNNPNHCCKEKGEARCIARACYRCPRTGRYYWTAAYR